MKKNLLLFFSILFYQIGIAQSPPAPLVWGSTAFQDSLWAFDTLSWTPVINIPTQGTGSSVSGINGLAFDPASYKTYAILKMSGSRYLSEISLPSGSCTVIGDLGDNFSSITFDKFGQLYGSTGDGATNPESLYKIDKATAASTLVFAMGNGADGEVICYNRFDNKMYHWSGNSSMVYESWPINSTSYAPTNISISGTTGGETFGALNLSANQFLMSNIASEFRYASATGAYGNSLNSNPDDIRGMVMPPRFSTSSTTLCAGSGSLNIYSAGLQQFDSVYYYWGDGNVSQILATVAGTAMHTYTSAGTYTLNVQLYNGAVAKSTIKTYTINVNTSPVVSISGSALLCPGGTVTLTASGGGSSQWYSGGVAVPGATLNTFTTSATGWFNMVKTNLSGCSDSAAVGVQVIAASAPTISMASSSICSGNTTTLVPSGADNYTISGGSFVVSPTSNSSYTVVGTNTAGCLSNTVVSTVSVYALPMVAVSQSNSFVCQGESATFSVSGAASYSWTTAETSSVIVVSPTLNTNYTVTGTSSEGCTSSSTLSLLVSECTSLNGVVRNTSAVRITPNPGSGLFELTQIPALAEVNIFNSLGQIVFQGISNGNAMHIDLGSFSNGVYLVRVIQNQQLISQSRLIKN